MRLVLLGLLLCVAVALLLPRTSEGRVYSQCELKEKLERELNLPEEMQRFKKQVAALVLCGLQNRTHLNTAAISVVGRHQTSAVTSMTVLESTTSTPAPSTAPTSTTCRTTPAATNMRSNSTSNTTAIPTHGTAVISPTMNTSTTTTNLTTPATTTDSLTPTAMKTLATTTAVLTTEKNSMEQMADSSVESNSNERAMRRKRQLDLMNYSSEEMGSGMTMEDQLNQEEDKFDEEELMRDDNNLHGENEEETLNDRWQLTWSLGFYGILQLSDSHFCLSGYRWSRNRCNTTCLAFTDEDLTDDIACLSMSGYWRYLCRYSRTQCYIDLMKECSGTGSETSSINGF